MANYIPMTRTNYFRIKPGTEDQFVEWAEGFGGEVWRDAEGRYALCGDSEGGWTRFDEDEDGFEGDTPRFAPDEIAPFLAPDSVAVFLEVGYEKLRYLAGHAIAVNTAGDQVQVSLRDIYGIARNMFGTQVEITEAEY